MLPLFSEEQMEQVEEMDQKAPMISGARALRDDPALSARGAHLTLEDGPRENAFQTPEVRRPAFPADEEQRRTGTPSPLRTMPPEEAFHLECVEAMDHNGMHGYGAMPDLVMQILHQAQQENERLRSEFASMAGEVDEMRRAKLELEAEKEAQECQRANLGSQRRPVKWTWRRSAWGCMRWRPWNSSRNSRP